MCTESREGRRACVPDFSPINNHAGNSFTLPPQRVDQHHPPSLELEPPGETEKRKTSSDVEKNPASRVKDRQHDQGRRQRRQPKIGKDGGLQSRSYVPGGTTEEDYVK